MFGKVLVANRGVIACRMLRTLRRMGIESVAVYSEPDRHARHVAMADAAVPIGPAAPSESYLSIERILEAARETGTEAIHPGYGFLSENAAFAEACEGEGIVFLGPTAEQMRAFGWKHTARELAARHGVPLLAGSELLQDAAHASRAAERIGYPVMLKATAGGGGIGMSLCREPSELASRFAAVERLGKANFQTGGVFLERFVERARHVEVQIFGDGRGEVIELGERDCSAQRRNQKVIEETPAPGLTDAARAAMREAAVRLAGAVSYRSAGTVEFLYDARRGDFSFLEVNTRLQVEHGVTEEVTGVDLVEWMIRLGAGELAPLDSLRPHSAGHSIQVRVYAEEPHRAFQPAAGFITQASFSNRARIETWAGDGTEVSPHYDPLLAKIIVLGKDRGQAVARLREALAETKISGIETNLDYLRHLAAADVFERGAFPTSWLSEVRYAPRAVEVIEPGMQTTVQDYPGRLGYWAVGVPPSGPMDALALKLANRAVGNEEGAAAIECTLAGPALKFHAPAVIAITGAAMHPAIDGAAAPMWRAMEVPAGAVLRFGLADGAGQRAYVAIAGGIDVPAYLGSRSTFILGKFGGHAGRCLQAGDLLRFGEVIGRAAEIEPPPAYGHTWEIDVLYGPHGAPDFFTARGMATLFDSGWRVHHNSDRTGVRLMGPKLEWARRDGGEAGLHPSNIHDNAYAVGAIDLTGDMPILLGPDGPSLGGFVCPAVVADGDLWKLGQLRAGDRVRFRRRDEEPAVLREAPGMVVRSSGDRYLLAEFGENHLDFELRLRAHACMEWFERERRPGIIDLTPGIRSLQIHYDPARIAREELLAALEEARCASADVEHREVPSRIVHLPLSWDDPATRLAIEKYMQIVRPDAPWCPDNIEFIRRINGQESVEEVRRMVFDACYLVLGLGDVYLGAPVATPIDPRHRLVTTKYNPARTWTPENAVGIGGAYLCVYGMEGPGGYQFVGRTVQMWNTHRATRDFPEGHPWLLRFFDQIRFYPVNAKELLRMRDDFPHGKFHVETEETKFCLRDVHALVEANRAECERFGARQRKAFGEERERWAAAGQAEYSSEPPPLATAGALNGDVPEGCRPLRAPMTSTVWKLPLDVGQRVSAGDHVLILAAMKMEMAVAAPLACEVVEVRCKEGDLVSAGQTLAVLRPTETAA